MPHNWTDMLTIDNNGTLTDSSGVITANTLTTQALTTFRQQDIELALSYAGSTTGSGNTTAIRGNVTVNAGTTVGGSMYVYGTQGKITVKGTLASSGWYSGLVGQVDTSAAAATHSSGRLTAIWADFGATSILTTDTNASLLLLTNTTNCLINAVVTVAANATYFADISDLAFGGKHFIVSGAVGGSQDKKLKCLIDGTAYYIPLNTA